MFKRDVPSPSPTWAKAQRATLPTSAPSASPPRAKRRKNRPREATHECRGNVVFRRAGEEHPDRRGAGAARAGAGAEAARARGQGRARAQHPARSRSRNTSTPACCARSCPSAGAATSTTTRSQFNIAIELGRSTCGSSAWCLNYLSDHAGILAHFPDEAQHDVWDENRDACIATSAAPTGKAEAAPAAIASTGNGRGRAASAIRNGS